MTADREAARRRLELADLNVGRATQAQKAGDQDAALIYAEQALINAAGALLARDGWSVSLHVVRFSYPPLPPVYASERGLIDQIRSARNTAQYDARDRVSAGLAADAIRVAERALLREVFLGRPSVTRIDLAVGFGMYGGLYGPLGIAATVGAQVLLQTVQSLAVDAAISQSSPVAPAVPQSGGGK